MSTKSKLLQILQENPRIFVSGQEIAESLGVSRAAVNKASKALRESGHEILSRPNQGYKLLRAADVLSEEAIEMHISKKCNLKVIESSLPKNNLIKALDFQGAPRALVTVFDDTSPERVPDTGSSDHGGLHISIILKPDFSLDKAPMFTLASALSVIRALDKVCSVSAKVRWVNDIFVSGERVASTITKVYADLESGLIHALEIAVDLQCFPTDITPPALSFLKPISDNDKAFSRAELAGTIIDNLLCMESEFLEKNFLPEYKRKCFIIGKIVSLHPFFAKDPIKVKVLDISDSGGLVAEYMEGIRMREIETIASGTIEKIY